MRFVHDEEVPVGPAHHLVGARSTPSSDAPHHRPGSRCARHRSGSRRGLVGSAGVPFGFVRHGIIRRCAATSSSMDRWTCGPLIHAPPPASAPMRWPSTPPSPSSSGTAAILSRSSSPRPGSIGRASTTPSTPSSPGRPSSARRSPWRPIPTAATPSGSVCRGVGGCVRRSAANHGRHLHRGQHRDRPALQDRDRGHRRTSLAPTLAIGLAPRVRRRRSRTAVEWRSRRRRRPALAIGPTSARAPRPRPRVRGRAPTDQAGQRWRPVAPGG